jgi:septal ring factor EnvC (AmiA/AmiB activator)
MNPSDSNGQDWRQRMDRFERGLEALLQAQAGLQTHVARHDAEFAELRNLFGRSLTVVEALAVRVTDLTAKVEDIAEAQRRTDEKLAQLADAQRHTDDRLNALIAVVDDFVRRQPPRQ